MIDNGFREAKTPYNFILFLFFSMILLIVLKNRYTVCYVDKYFVLYKITNVTLDLMADYDRLGDKGQGGNFISRVSH